MYAAQLVRVLQGDSLCLAVATATEVCLLQKKWVALKSASLYTASAPITALQCLPHFLAILSAELTLFSLSSLQPLYSLSLFPMSLFTFTSDSLAFLYSPTCHQSIQLSPGLNPSPVLPHSFGQASIAPFHLYWLLVLSLDCSLRMLNAALEVEFSMQIGLFGRIMGEIGAGMEFFVVNEKGIERFEACSEEQHITYMVENGYFETAIEFLKAKKGAFPTSDILKLLKVVVAKQGQLEMQRFALRLIEEKVTQWPILLSALPAQLQSLLRIAPKALLSPAYLDQWGDSPSPSFPPKCPPSQPPNPPVVGESPPAYLFTSLETTIESLLAQRSPDIFTLFSSSHADISHFLRNLTVSQAEILAEIDVKKAAVVVLSRWPEAGPVFSADLQYHCSLHRWRQGLYSAETADLLVEEMIRRKEDGVVDFLRGLEGGKLEFALQLASKYNHLPAQVYLFDRLNRHSEVALPLKSDLTAALRYLEVHWDQELWDFVLASDLSTLSTAILSCLYMHPAATFLVEQVQGSGITYEEVKPMLRNVHSATEIQRNANKIAEKERIKELKLGNKAISRGFYVPYKGKCGLCEETLVNNCVLRYCKHHFHLSCTSDLNCPLCKTNFPLS